MELTYSGLRVDVENFQGCGATMTIFSTEILYAANLELPILYKISVEKIVIVAPQPWKFSTSTLNPK
jgi:hypothetical protein